MTFIDQPNVLNPATSADSRPLHRLWADWLVRLAMNLNTIMKRLVLGGSWASRRMKAIRFSFINIPGRIVERSRELIVRLVKGHPAFELYLEARRRIMGMIPALR